MMSLSLKIEALLTSPNNIIRKLGLMALTLIFNLEPLLYMEQKSQAPAEGKVNFG